ncbi:MAG: hypothetical protein ACJAUW_001503 [Yoonia sp.]|jgi:hypothetical protein
MSKRANPMAVRAALTYEVAEAAKALGKSPATIRNWIKDGLPVLASKQPYLISGAAIRDYLRTKHQASKSPLGPNELYCLSCRTGRMPVNMVVEATSNNISTIRLQGTCCHCGALASRLISISKAQNFAQTFRFQRDGNS